MKGVFKKILIINTFGIGDVLFSTPLVRAIKKLIPDATVDFMCNKRTEAILINNENIDSLIIFEKDEFRQAFKNSKIGFMKMAKGFIKQLKAKKYDLVIDLSLGYQVSLLLKILGVKKRIGLNFRNRGRFLTDKVDITGFNDKHVVEYFLDILRLVGITDFADKKLELKIAPETEQWAKDFIAGHGLKGKKLIGVAPGGGKSWGEDAVYRRWSPENFGYVAKKLFKKRNDIFFMIFGSKEEVAICKMVEDIIQGSCVNLAGNISLQRSISLIKRCSVVLCNDGGILHIAVSQGIKTVSIFGPVDDKVYGPYPPSFKDRVITANNVKCRPCYKNFRHKMCERRRCLKDINKDAVYGIVETSLNS